MDLLKLASRNTSPCSYHSAVVYSDKNISDDEVIRQAICHAADEMEFRMSSFNELANQLGIDLCEFNEYDNLTSVVDSITEAAGDPVSHLIDILKEAGFVYKYSVKPAKIDGATSGRVYKYHVVERG